MKNTNETLTTLIRKSVRSFLMDHSDLSSYRINKIIKGELENPCSWWHPDDAADDHESGIVRFYNSLDFQNVFLKFKDHLLLRYGVSI